MTAVEPDVVETPVETPKGDIDPSALSILANIQQSMRAPKAEHNDYGNYNYRNVETILSEAKKLARPYGAAVVCSDGIEYIEGRWYVRATVSLVTPHGTISATAYAREVEQRKGMDPGQITGSCSSYARKYAAQGLFAISGEGVEDLDALPPDIDVIWPQGQFDAKCGRCGRIGHNLNSKTVKTFRCPDCGATDWKPLE